MHESATTHDSDVSSPLPTADLCRTIFEHAADAILVATHAGRFVAANPAAAALLGYRVDELLCRAWSDCLLGDALLLPPDVPPGQTVRQEGHLRGADGRLRIVAIATCRLPDGTLLSSLHDITALVEAEAALRARAARLRLVADSLPQLIWTWGPDGACDYVNQQWVTYTGLPQSALLGLGWLEPVHPDDRAPTAAAARAAIAAESPFHAECRFRHHDGSYRWFDTRAVPLRDGDGRIVTWVGANTDIDEAHELRERLREESERFATIAAVAPGVIHAYRLRPDGSSCFPYASPAITEIYGLTSEELADDAAAIAALVHPDDKPHIVATTAESARTMTPWHSEHRVRHPTKGERWVEVHASPRHEPDGSVLWYGMLTDVTARKQAAAALQQSEARFAKAFRASPVALCLTRLDDGRFVDVNDRFLELFELQPDAIVGTSPAGLQLYPEPGRRDEFVNHLRAQGAIRDLETTARTRSGRLRIVLLSAELLDLGTESCILTLLTDITEHRHAEVTRARLEAELRHAQKMESIGQLAGGVAHDFNNLLTAIGGYTELALADLATGSPIRADLAEIQRATDRAGALTRQLLAFARRQRLEMRPLDLNQLAASVAKLLRRLIGEHIQLVVEAAPDLGVVVADPGQLEQVLVNLAVNARDAMPMGGTLTIGTANVDLDPRSAPGHLDLPAGRYVQLTVSDTGVGVPPEHQPHLFEPFFTTKPLGEGTGLGLATCYGIVQQHGGAIAIASEVGQGTAVAVYLPRSSGAEGDSGPDAAPVALPEGTETILLAEDDPAVRALTARVLRACGYTVLVAANGVEALRLAQHHAPGAVDLLLSDVVMPALAGPALAAQLRQQYPRVKVVFMSGYSTHPALPDADGIGGDWLLAKPFTPAELAQWVRARLDAEA